jgi:hypothetical protein
LAARPQALHCPTRNIQAIAVAAVAVIAAVSVLQCGMLLVAVASQLRKGVEAAIFFDDCACASLKSIAHCR